MKYVHIETLVSHTKLVRWHRCWNHNPPGPQLRCGYCRRRRRVVNLGKVNVFDAINIVLRGPSRVTKMNAVWRVRDVYLKISINVLGSMEVPPKSICLSSFQRRRNSTWLNPWMRCRRAVWRDVAPSNTVAERLCVDVRAVPKAVLDILILA